MQNDEPDYKPVKQETVMRMRVLPASDPAFLRLQALTGKPCVSRMFIETATIISAGAFIEVFVQASASAPVFHAAGQVKSRRERTSPTAQPAGIAVDIFEMAPVSEAPAPRKIPIPLPKGVADCLTTLLGRPVDAKPASLLSYKPGVRMPSAVFMFDKGDTAAICLCDMSLASRLGAALSIIPDGAAVDCVREGRLSDTIAENFREIMNVAGSLLNHSGAAHVKLKATHCPPEALPVDETAKIAAARRLDIEVSIQDYGVGKMAFLLLD